MPASLLFLCPLKSPTCPAWSWNTVNTPSDTHTQFGAILTFNPPSNCSRHTDCVLHSCSSGWCWALHLPQLTPGLPVAGFGAHIPFLPQWLEAKDPTGFRADITGKSHLWSDSSSCQQISLAHTQVSPAAGTESHAHTHKLCREIVKKRGYKTEHTAQRLDKHSDCSHFIPLSTPALCFFLLNSHTSTHSFMSLHTPVSILDSNWNFGLQNLCWPSLKWFLQFFDSPVRW